MTANERIGRVRRAAAEPWTSRVIFGDRVGVPDPPEWLTRAYATFRDNVLDDAFPCFFGTRAERRAEMFYAFASGDDWGHLGATVARFCALSRSFEHRHSNLALFFEPRDVPLGHEQFRAFCWDVLQTLRDGDDSVEGEPVEPSDAAWEFTAYGTQMFVVGCGPSYVRRRSRNLGPGVVMLFQPRAVFVDPVTKRAISMEARAEVRRRLVAWDGMAPHPDLGVYGDPENREWKQYFLPDDNTPEVARCPFIEHGSRARIEDRASDLVAILRHRARMDPSGVAMRFVADSSAAASVLTYADLDRSARGMAAQMLERARAGDRALLLLPTGAGFVKAFFACLYAGIIAVPAYPPSAGNPQHAERLRGILKDARPALLVVDAATEPKLGYLPDADASQAFVTADDWGDVPDLEPVPPSGDAIALLQYTSGSTGEPKGVMVTHGNLLANASAICSRMKLDERDSMACWLPLYHDMGLVSGVVLPVYKGMAATLLSPQLILESPATWLKVIARYGATVSGGPDFVYPLCVDRVRDEQIQGIDLSRWRVAFCGSEPIRARSMEAFAARFAAYGFRAGALCPCYGLAEATLLVSSCRPGEGANAARFDAAELGRGKVQDVVVGGAVLVDCGVIPSRHRVRITDPVTFAECEPGRVGEIWVTGPSVTAGYWKNDAATNRTFPTIMAADGVPERYLRTGDLGFLRRGRLFVCGRHKDLIILRGQNLYPQDVERTLADRVTGLNKGRIAAFPSELDGVEGIGVAAEVSTEALRARSADDFVRAIRRAIAAEYRESVHLVLLLRTGQLPRTSSGKLRRSSCVVAYERGELKTVAVYRREPGESGAPSGVRRTGPRSAVEHALASVWGEVLGRRDFGVRDDFFETGGDSLAAAALLARVEEVFGVAVSLEAVFEARTIEQQAQLIGADVGTTPSRRAPIPRGATGPVPLSYQQQSLWFLWKLDPRSTAYTLTLSVRLRGELNKDALHRAFERLVERHAALRTRFAETDGVPFQVVSAAAAFEWSEVESTPDEAPGVFAQLSTRPFDLVEGPLLRVALVRVSPAEHVLTLATHHIVADAGSAQILWRELSAFYDAERAGTSVALDEPLQYVDYAAWQRGETHSERLEPHLSYFRALLSPEAITELPGRLKEQDGERPRAGRTLRRLTAEQTEPLRRLARSERATLSLVLLAAFDVLLRRHASGREVVVGVPVAGRLGRETEGCFGLFVNVLVHRATIAGSASFREVLAHVRARMLEAHAHQEAPFERVVAALRPQRDQGTPIVRVTFNHQQREASRVCLSNVTADDVELHEGSPPFDWTLNVRETPEALLLSLDYRADLFDGATVEQALEDYVSLLEQISIDPGVRVEEIRFSTPVDSPRVTPFLPFCERFSRQAKVTPDAIAVSCEGAKLTYAELDAWSNGIGGALVRYGLERNEKVGLCIERGPALVAGLLGIAKTGAAFVPLDPSYPTARLEAMMDDAGTRLIVADASNAASLRARFPNHSVLVITEDARGALGGGSRPVHADEIAYVMFTSGSSGRPKGVEVSHRALAAHLDDYLAVFELGASDAVLQFSTVSFDASIEQLLPVLTVGGRVVMRGPGIWSWDELNRWLESERVTLAYLPTGYFRQWLHHLPDAAPPSLRRVSIGGEALSGDALSRWYASSLGTLPLDNTYGPTEATITTSAHRTREADMSLPIVPIGTSLPARSAWVLDDEGAVVPAGGTGELCLGGVALANGYLKRPALTAERFVPDPNGAPGTRLYRTGDRCRRRRDGTLEFLGRRDGQVKLRGHRIELGEVESALRRAPGVADAVAVLDGAGEHARVVGYVTGASDEAVVRGHVAELLPAYMLPSAIVPLERLPLLPNGKLDRAALPAPPQAIVNKDQREPRDPAEVALLAIFREVLRRPDAGLGDDFFMLGGDSILCLQVVARARQRGWSLTLKQIFEHPTVEGAARASKRIGPKPGDDGGQRSTDLLRTGAFLDVSIEELGLPPGDVQDVYPATPVQQGLLFHDALDGDKGVYVHQVRLTLRGRLDRAAFRRAWESAVARHDVMRTGFVWTRSRGALQVVRRSARLPYFEHVPVAPDHERWVSQLCAEDVRRGFEVGEAPLLRVHVVERPDGAHELVLTNHHAIFDGWSVARVLSEVLEQHDAIASGRSPSAHAAPAFGEYVRWLSSRADGEAWWRAELARWNDPATLGDGIGAARLAEPGTHHLRERGETALVDALKRAAGRAGVTLHSVVQGAWAIVLSRYADREQAVFGSTVAGRPPELEDVESRVGLFIHTVPVRVDVRSGLSVDEWLRDLQRHFAGVREHETTSLGSIQSWARSRGSSLFDSVIVFENYPVADSLAAHSGLLAIEQVETSDRTHYPLTLTVFPRQGLELDWEWDGERVDGRRVKALSRHFREVLERLASDGDKHIDEIALSIEPGLNVAPREREFVPVLRRIEEQASSRRDSVGLRCEGEDATYGSLWAWSNRVGRALQRAGVRAESLVGLCVERSVGLVAGLLGIWKAGG
ncbi:MAG TPA: amino acid adenylation domain-containing protein, partial [Polyangiaceae bacterium]|nr:amino acid adenylation domain-containing protein [Polyangiaceae bacterium]